MEWFEDDGLWLPVFHYPWWMKDYELCEYIRQNFDVRAILDETDLDNTDVEEFFYIQEQLWANENVYENEDI